MWTQLRQLLTPANGGVRFVPRPRRSCSPGSRFWVHPVTKVTIATRLVAHLGRRRKALGRPPRPALILDHDAVGGDLLLGGHALDSDGHEGVQSAGPIVPVGHGRRRRTATVHDLIAARSSSTRCLSWTPCRGGSLRSRRELSQTSLPAHGCLRSLRSLRVSRPPKAVEAHVLLADSSRETRHGQGRGSGPGEPRSYMTFGSSTSRRLPPPDQRSAHARRVGDGGSKRPAGRLSPRSSLEPGSRRNRLRTWTRLDGSDDSASTGPRLASITGIPDSRDGVDAPGCTDRRTCYPTSSAWAATARSS